LGSHAIKGNKERAGGVKTDRQTKKPFVGTWKGICADGAESVVLKLSQREDEMAGTVSMDNMNSGTGPM